MYSPGASSASVTSGSSPTGAGRRCCRCVSRSSGRRSTHRPSPTRRRKTRHGRYGFARSAALTWRLSRDSRLPKRASVLLQARANDHDLFFLISNLISAGATAGEDRSPVGGSHRRASRYSSKASICHPDAYFSPYLILSCHPIHNSKPIRSAFQTAHFKSLYRKRSGVKISRHPRVHRAGAFPIQP